MTLNEAHAKAKRRYEDMEAWPEQLGAALQAEMQQAWKAIRTFYSQYEDLVKWKPEQAQRWEAEALTVMTEHFIAINNAHKKWERIMR